MTDEELLMYQLRNPPVMSMALNKDHLYSMMHERMSLAADRIEELGEELELAQGATNHWIIAYNNMEDIRSYFIEILFRLNDIEKAIKDQRREEMADRLYGAERYTDHGRIDD